MITENKIVKRAIKIIERSVREAGEQFKNSRTAETYCRLILGQCKEEEFMVIFLDNNNKWINSEVLFKGTINEAIVYPRAIVRKIIEYNAAKIILSHNHPSGNKNPSKQDISITQRIKDICNIIDCQVLDHIIVTAKDSFSFADENLI
jgi:DNA repair protein RadC